MSLSQFTVGYSKYYSCWQCSSAEDSREEAEGIFFFLLFLWNHFSLERSPLPAFLFFLQEKAFFSDSHFPTKMLFAQCTCFLIVLVHVLYWPSFIGKYASLMVFLLYMAFSNTWKNVYDRQNWTKSSCKLLQPTVTLSNSGQKLF